MPARKTSSLPGVTTEHCPKCGLLDNMVIDSRPSEFGRRRRRRCTVCGSRWSTVELSYDVARGIAQTRREMGAMIEGLQRLRDVLPELPDDITEADAGDGF